MGQRRLSHPSVCIVNPALLKGRGVAPASPFSRLTIENKTDTIDGPLQNGAGMKVRVASGVSFATLARRMANAGYAGLEWACGIPGSLGGAVVTNAGAYDRSLADVVRGARLASNKGEVMELDPAALHLTYRNSAFTRGSFDSTLPQSLTAASMAARVE